MTFSLYRSSKPGANRIKNWASNIPAFSNPGAAKPKGKSSATTSSKSNRIPSLTKGPSTKSSSTKSVISNDIAIIDSRPNPDVNDAIQVHEGGLEDEDEIFGLEREVAVASPVKGKTRLTSAVFYTELLSGCRAKPPCICL